MTALNETEMQEMVQSSCNQEKDHKEIKRKSNKKIIKLKES